MSCAWAFRVLPERENAGRYSPRGYSFAGASHAVSELLRGQRLHRTLLVRLFENVVVGQFEVEFGA